MTEPLDWDALVMETKRRRRAEGLTQQTHAAVSGVSRDTIRAFDRFERTLTLEKAFAILRVVGLASERQGIRDQQNAFVRDSLERWNTLVRDLPEDAPARFPHGNFRADYTFIGKFNAPDSDALLDLLVNLPSVSGWPPFPVLRRKELAPRLEPDGTIEAWLGRPTDEKLFADAPHVDYWRADPHARFFTIRGLQEDGDDSQEPGTFLDVILPIWRAADLVEHAILVAKRLSSGVEEIVFDTVWSGIAGRRLVSWTRPTRLTAEEAAQRARVNQVRSTARLSYAKPSAENFAQCIRDLVRPLYAAFDSEGWEQIVQEELNFRLSDRRRRGGARIDPVPTLELIPFYPAEPS